MNPERPDDWFDLIPKGARKRRRRAGSACACVSKDENHSHTTTVSRFAARVTPV